MTIDIEKIHDEIESASKISVTDLEAEIVRTGVLSAKFLRYHHKLKLAIHRGNSVLNGLVRDKLQYYKGNGSPKQYREKPFRLELTNQKDRDIFLDADEDLCAYREKLDEYVDVLCMVDAVLDTLKYRNNHIATIFEMRKFEAGA